MMFSLLGNSGMEVPLVVGLLALMWIKFDARPRVALRIKAKPEKLWRHLCPRDGKLDNWGRVTIHTRQNSTDPTLFTMTYNIAVTNNAPRTQQANFRLVTCEKNKTIVLRRDDLGTRKTDGELLEIRHDLQAEGESTHLITSYRWGRRALLGQLTSRTDLWGGIFRLKALIETGRPSNRVHSLINILVAVFTAAISLAVMGLLASWTLAATLLFVLLVHEFGHLLAFRMLGQPWGRMIFLPFLGAVAVPRLSMQDQSEGVFAALMGPGISCLLALACLVPYSQGWTHNEIFATCGLVTAAVNIFNMLPAEPLDGGIALRSILARLAGTSAWAAQFAFGSLVCIYGWYFSNLSVLLFGALAVATSLRKTNGNGGLAPLSLQHVGAAVLFYFAITVTHFALLGHFLHQLGA